MCRGIDELAARSAYEYALRAAWAAAAGVRRASCGALNHDLLALSDAIGDLDERVVLKSCLDRTARRLSVVANHLDHLLTALAAYRAERHDQDIVLLVDGDGRRSRQAR